MVIGIIRSLTHQLLLSIVYVSTYRISPIQPARRGIMRTVQLFDHAIFVRRSRYLDLGLMFYGTCHGFVMSRGKEGHGVFGFKTGQYWLGAMFRYDVKKSLGTHPEKIHRCKPKKPMSFVLRTLQLSNRLDIKGV